MARRVCVIGHFRMPIEHLADAREAMARVIAATRAEAGCIAYSYAEDLIEPGMVRVSEIWESRERLADHFATPHMKQWAEERAGFGLFDRQITAYTLEGSEEI